MRLLSGHTICAVVIGIIVPGGVIYKGNFIFIIIVGLVRSETDKSSNFMIVECFINKGFGMNEHFKFLVLPQVNVHIFIGNPCIAIGQITNFKNNGLLIQLCNLGLTGIDNAVDSREEEHNLQVLWMHFPQYSPK